MSENALPTTNSASYSRIDDPTTTTAPHSKHQNHKRHKRKGGGGGLTSGALNSLKRPIVYLPLAGLCVVTVLVLRGWNRGMERVQGGDKESYLSETMHDSLERLSKGWSTSLRGGSRPSSNEDDGEWNCNPFETNGRLNVNLQDPTKTSWVPFDSRCNPSNYMKALYRPPGDTSPLIPDANKSPHGREYLSWFKNRTIILHGDSIDRFHLKDFCEFVGGRLELIGTDHQANPAMWKKPGGDRERRDWEKNWSERPREGQELTNPWICDVEEYGTTLINVFTWGLEGAEEFFKTERWYYPPATWNDRMDHITLPLLPRLAKYLDRPQIENPDLVILNSGYWDLRKYTEEDFVAAGFPNRPYPEDSPIPYNALSLEREQNWEKEARKAIKHAAKSFRGKEGKTKNGPTLLWRSLHHPPRHNYAPFPRVFQLDSLSRKVVADLRLSQSPSASTPSTFTPSAPLSQLDEYPDREDLGLDHRLRIDESGRLMLGQEHLFRDLLHPLPVPGSWVWADIMLYELKRAVEGVDR